MADSIYLRVFGVDYELSPKALQLCNTLKCCVDDTDAIAQRCPHPNNANSVAPQDPLTLPSLQEHHRAAFELVWKWITAATADPSYTSPPPTLASDTTTARVRLTVPDPQVPELRLYNVFPADTHFFAMVGRVAEVVEMLGITDLSIMLPVFIAHIIRQNPTCSLDFIFK